MNLHPGRRELSSGFSLIEIIAVLVILGILFSVATVHYSRVEQQAAEKAAEAAAANGIATCSLNYARDIMSKGAFSGCPQGADLITSEGIQIIISQQVKDSKISCLVQAINAKATVSRVWTEP